MKANNYSKHLELLLIAFEIILLCIVSVLGFTIFISDSPITENLLVFETGCCILICGIVYLYCFTGNHFKERFALFSFVTAFTILILGRYIVGAWDGSVWGSYVFQRMSSISYESEARALIYIFVSFSLVALTYQFTWRKHSAIVYDKKDRRRENAERSYGRLRYWCMFFMIIGGIATFVLLALKIVFVFRNGYLSTYLSSGGALYQNTVLNLLDKFYLLGLYGYMATFPEKQKIKTPLIVFVVYSALTLLTGTRGGFVVNILLLIWYLMKRDQLGIDEEPIIKRRHLFLLLILSIGLAIFLLSYRYMRIGATYEGGDLFTQLIVFIDSEGGIGRLVPLSLENKLAMEEYISPFLMLFAPIKNYLMNNAVVRLFTGGSLGQSMNTLYNAPSFDSVLTYVTNPEAYLSGGGVGTCYIAELACSYGLVAIVLFNIVLGYALMLLDSVGSRSWGIDTFLLSAFAILIYLPRHACLQIIPESITLFIFVIVVSILSRKRKEKSGRINY